MAPPRAARVAVLDTDRDTTDLLKAVLAIDGMVVTTANPLDFAHDPASVVEFLQRAAPDVIVYDLAFPYEETYRFLQEMRDDPRFPKCALVITTTNVRVVGSLPGTEAIEIVGKPYDVETLLKAIRASGGKVPRREGREDGAPDGDFDQT